MKKSEWYNVTIRKVNDLNIKLDKRKVRRFRVSLLIKMISRIEEFSLQSCDQCENYKQNIEQMISMLEQDSSANIKEFRSIFNEILKHLKKDHGLVEEGTYMPQWLSLGLIFGVAFMFTYTYSISIGMLLGIVIGSMLDENAKKKGKQI
ncbi:hypothetical protein [Bacillus sp. 1NLA3E]|uniref:hypothetical protein n=1 Tax=Bacillus sp. 1NLA3E TaxID=666686 RepID=UPI000247EB85|nr:hypothetical protein [Bacillus sp. 1NLA3E]AGK55764.1 hypothetical protein B1NLA3E_20110 [Bacillus sp. 1NLA3E]